MKNIDDQCRELDTKSFYKKPLQENEIVRSKGRLMAYSESELFIQYNKGCVHFYGNKDLYKHKGKTIELVVRVIKDD